MCVCVCLHVCVSVTARRANIAQVYHNFFISQDYREYKEFEKSTKDVTFGKVRMCSQHRWLCLLD